MATIQVHDKITPALRQLEHRLTNRRLILHLGNSGYHKFTVQKPAPHTLRLLAVYRNKPTTTLPARERYVLVGGQKFATLRARALLAGGVKYPVAASHPTLPPAVVRQARWAASEFVRAEIEGR